MKFNLATKEKKLADFISQYKSAVIPFSGGIDSTLLAKITKNILGQKVHLVTILFSTIYENEISEINSTAKSLNIFHKKININELLIPGFAENTPDKCYLCKKFIFSKIQDYAKSINFDIVFDGSNCDDISDYRPGRKALKELGIVSPFLAIGLNKQEIRDLAKTYNLANSLKPSNSCTATRIPYEEIITYEKLNRINHAENEIKKLGFSQFRVRNHNNLARLEFIKEELPKAWELKNNLSDICMKAGFTYAAIDCTGYCTGKMNKSLSLNQIDKYRSKQNETDD